jgi:hypothetical protein
MSTRNITKAYRLSTLDDRIAGEQWYARAKAFAADLDTNVERAVGVIAALSPMMPWPRNQSLAREVYMGKRDGCLSANMAKAVRILNGEAPLDVLSGEKVRAFYLNIMGIDEDSAVTIDRHAIMVALGKNLASDELKFTKAQNRAIADEYRAAAKILSREVGYPLTPAQVQATVWVWWRKNRSLAYHGEGE